MIKKAFMTGLMIISWISSAFADGDSRPATAGEKDFSLKVLKAFESALPKGPEGCAAGDKTLPGAPRFVVQGQENFPMKVEYYAQWQDTPKINAQASRNDEAVEQQFREMPPHDVDLRVDMSANVFYQEFTKTPSDQSLLDGCRLIRIDDQDSAAQGGHEGSTYVFVGDFKVVKKDGNISMHAGAFF